MHYFLFYTDVREKLNSFLCLSQYKCLVHCRYKSEQNHNILLLLRSTQGMCFLNFDIHFTLADAQVASGFAISICNNYVSQSLVMQDLILCNGFFVTLKIQQLKIIEKGLNNDTSLATVVGGGQLSSYQHFYCRRFLGQRYHIYFTVINICIWGKKEKSILTFVISQVACFEEL